MRNRLPCAISSQPFTSFDHMCMGSESGCHALPEAVCECSIMKSTGPASGICIPGMEPDGFDPVWATDGMPNKKISAAKTTMRFMNKSLRSSCSNRFFEKGKTAQQSCENQG